MIVQNAYPILEYDNNPEGLINPQHLQAKYGLLCSDRLVITFFKKEVATLLEEGVIERYLTIEGENDLVLYRFVDTHILLMHGIIGCPACGGFLDELIGLGITKVVFCGGGGVLDSSIKPGELMVVSGAIRDEGFSYHYLPASRIVEANQAVQSHICAYLDEKNIPHLRGLAWTTDAFYRETPERIRLRKAEGAQIVEMEQAACIAVSQFRGIAYGAILYGGDDVSSDVWDDRSWHTRTSVRYSLIAICHDCVRSM